jgi:hypothetical protein
MSKLNSDLSDIHSIMKSNIQEVRTQKRQHIVANAQLPLMHTHRFSIEAKS